MEVLKGNKDITYKRSTANDIIELTGEKPTHSVKALSFFLKGELIAIAGYKMENGHFVVFSNIKKDVSINKVTIWRATFVVMDLIAKENVPMYAVAHNEKLCEKLGFKRLKGDVYIWQN